jgi:hypothetical protein
MSYTDTTKLDLKKADPGTNQPFETDVFNDNLDKIDAEAVAVDARFDVIEANNWVTNARLADNSVGSAELQTNSVGADELQPFAVVLGKIAPNAVTSSELASNSVGADELQPNSVGSSELASNSVIESKLASGSVSDAKLQGGLNASKLQFGTLNPSLLPDGGIDASKMSSYLDFTSKNVFVSGGYVGPTSVASHEVAYNYAQGAVSGLASDRNIPAKFASGNRSGTPSSGILTVDLTSFGFSAIPVVTANIVQPSTSKFVVGIASVSATQVQFRILTSTGANATVSTDIYWQAVQD